MVSSKPAETMPITPFDEYGEIGWEEERARLDNFAIQLQQDQDLIGYILVYEVTGGCLGEAQARALRAKRYVVEHRGVEWKRIMWRQEGYQADMQTTLLLVKRDVILPRPFLHPTTTAANAEVNGACRRKIKRIRKSPW